MNNLKYFLQNNSSKKVIAVQGLGFVGSVMSLVCANAINGNYAVIGVDVPTKRGKKITDDLNNGIFPLVAEDPKIDQLFKKSIAKENFFATTEQAIVEFTSPTTMSKSGFIFMHTSSNKVIILAV